MDRNCVTLIVGSEHRKTRPSNTQTLISEYNIKKRPITRNATPSPGHNPIASSNSRVSNSIELNQRQTDYLPFPIEEQKFGNLF